MGYVWREMAVESSSDLLAVWRLQVIESHGSHFNRENDGIQQYLGVMDWW